jgi:hypothetical protein
MFTQFQIHLPLDQSVPAVFADQHHRRDLFAYCGFDLLGVHQEGAVPHHDEHLRIRLGQSDTERPGQRKRMVDRPLEIRQVFG